MANHVEFRYITFDNCTNEMMKGVRVGRCGLRGWNRFGRQGQEDFEDTFELPELGTKAELMSMEEVS